MIWVLIFVSGSLSIEVTHQCYSVASVMEQLNHGAIDVVLLDISMPHIDDGKALVKLRSSKDAYWLAANQNNDILKLFAPKYPMKTIPVNPTDVGAFITDKKGCRITYELYYGCSFLSQSDRFISVDPQTVSQIRIRDSKGQIRRLEISSLN